MKLMQRLKLLIHLLGFIFKWPWEIKESEMLISSQMSVKVRETGNMSESRQSQRAPSPVHHVYRTKDMRELLLFKATSPVFAAHCTILVALFCLVVINDAQQAGTSPPLKWSTVPGHTVPLGRLWKISLMPFASISPHEAHRCASTFNQAKQMNQCT